MINPWENSKKTTELTEDQRIKFAKQLLGNKLLVQIIDQMLEDCVENLTSPSPYTEQSKHFLLENNIAYHTIRNLQSMLVSEANK